jgi:nucleoside-diphosphate-sugar epimerase
LKRIAVTGAAGFIGRRVVLSLERKGVAVRAIVRSPARIDGAAETCLSGNLADAGRELFAGCDAVVHCAARVHVMRPEAPAMARVAYDLTNRELPLKLAAAARDAGVSRFVQLSSLAAVCSTTAPGEVADDDTPPRPTTPYGRGKLAADLELSAMADQDFTVVSLRPPAVYGPGVGAWFAQLLRAARLGVPLPVGGIRNRRSFAFVDNVADACAIAAIGPLPPSGAYLVTDSEPVSTADLYDRLCQLNGYGKRAWRWPAGPVRVAIRAVLGGRSDSALGDAACGGARFSSLTGWTPPVDWEAALQQTVAAAPRPRGTP